MSESEAETRRNKINKRLKSLNWKFIDNKDIQDISLLDAHVVEEYPTETGPADYVFFWIYDNRTNIPGVTKKDRPFITQMFEEFEKCYGIDPNGQAKRKEMGDLGSFRKFSLARIKERDYNLDITWLKDEGLEGPNSLPKPQVLAADAITELNACVDELQEILTLIEAEEAE
jgi:hypothetical protein